MSDVPDPADYCRQVETYLCRKNGGHLIRIVGPAFEQVCGWALQGVPLTIALRGIDRCCERRQSAGARRRPLRIEFCEPDILELFDDWRRAVGVTAAAPSESRDTLPSHLDRAIARLTTARGGGSRSSATAAAIDAAVRELDCMKGSARTARGDERARLIARLETLDSELLDAARAELSAAEARELRRQAGAELAPFAPRMAADALAHALDVAFGRLLREHAGLPELVFD
ncbi:MAG TPA: hypothetical protein VFX12_14775 [Vicinamibacterales bacterium]|nr:hypothetical protein [Vicinamibacterales bacterium]